MRPPLQGILILVCVVIAGCVAPSAQQDEDGRSDGAAEGGANPPTPGVEYGLTGPATTVDAGVGYRVASDGPVAVAVELDSTLLDSRIVDGEHAWSLPMRFGQTRLNVSIEAPGLDVMDSHLLVRLSESNLTIDYCYFHPDGGEERRVDNYTFLIDVDARPSQPAYDANNASRLDAFTVHDQLWVFEASSGVPVDVTYYPQYGGFFMDRIDGVGNPASSSAPPYWIFRINGDIPPGGMSLESLQPGDSVKWTLSTFSAPCE